MYATSLEIVARFVYSYQSNRMFKITASKSTTRPLVVASVMTSMAMVAIEATIVSTAMPQIAAVLGGMELYSWVFSAFLLAQTALTVVFGKASDVFGRKPAILAGITLFVIGSVLAGLSWSMPSLIAFRLVQGIGAGAIMPVTLTIIGDLYPPKERGRIQGYLASVWAICAVLGPVCGSLLVKEASWKWIFWMNVPIGLIAALGFIRYFQETKRNVTPCVDWLGAILFTVAVADLMLLLSQLGSVSRNATLSEVVILLVVGLVFTRHERRVPDPMVPLDLWASRPVATCNLSTLLTGMTLMGLTTFLPMYVQGVMQQSPVSAGFALTTMMIGWPTGATVTSRTFHVIGLRRALIGGTLLIPMGTVPLVLLTHTSTPVFAALSSLIMGFGMGVCSVSCMILLQEIVPADRRGSATASNFFARNLGSTLGASFFGAVVNAQLSHSNAAPHLRVDDLSRLFATNSANSLAAGPLRLALQQSLHVMFITMALVATCALISMALLPSLADLQMRPSQESA